MKSLAGARFVVPGILAATIVAGCADGGQRTARGPGAIEPTLAPITVEDAPGTADADAVRDRLASMRMRMDAMGDDPSEEEVQSMLDTMGDTLDMMQSWMDEMSPGMPPEHSVEMRAMMTQMEEMMGDMRARMSHGHMMGMMSDGRSMDQMMQRMQTMRDMHAPMRDDE